MASEPLREIELTEDARERAPSRRRRFRGWLARGWQRMQPGPPARKGAARGVAVIAALAAVLVGIWLRPGLGALDVPAGILVALLFAVLISLGVIGTLKLLALLPRFLGWTGFGALGALVFVLVAGFRLPPGMGLPAALAIAAVAALLGGSLALLLGREPLGRKKRAVLSTLAVVGLAAGALGVWWLLDRGDTEDLVKLKRPDPVRVAPLAAADPSLPGPHRILTLTYGSGTDRQRPEFAKEADLKSRTVDGTPFVKGNEGWKVGMRDWFWGFDFKKMPLNGRVWYPEGPGPFPLVLVVHGNHNMAHFSDPGYAWLAEILASRGFITVSVDENFLNSSWVGGLEKENDARGWLLLKHVEQWRDWNLTAGNPLHNKVDMDRIALIGHSRGGEAVGIAAAFNRLPRYPDDATVPLGFNFGIRSIVAIAPVDGQYKPAGKPTPVSDVNYLVLHGAHDGDVSIFMGDRLYRRLEFKEKGRRRFKAEVYSYRSNHGQWNTVWNDADAGWPTSLILNRGALLAPEDQRKLGAVSISGFLEATLHDNPAYVRLFRDLRAARAWLPEDLYISRFQDSTFRLLVDAEEDVDVTTTALEEGGVITGRHLALWKEKDLAFRQGEGTKQNQVIYLGWKRDTAKPKEVATWAVRLPTELPEGWTLGPDSLLSFSLTDSGEEAPDPKDKEKDKKEGKKSDAEKEADKKEEEKKEKEREERKKREKKEGKEPLDLSIELVTADGAAVRLPLSRFRALPVPLESRVTRLPDESELFGEAWEPTLQTFELPLRAFAAARPGFDPAAVREIRFVFDRSPEGVVILDDLGFADSAHRPVDGAPVAAGGAGALSSTDGVAVPGSSVN
jgi:dienelactone hydrolase